jgi:hypothetical protein
MNCLDTISIKPLKSMPNKSSPSAILARFFWGENKWIDREILFVPRIGERVLVTDPVRKHAGDDWMVEGEVLSVEWSFRGGAFGYMVSITIKPRFNQTGPPQY